jgi:hypothetical protein
MKFVFSLTAAKYMKFLTPRVINATINYFVNINKLSIRSELFPVRGYLVFSGDSGWLLLVQIWKGTRNVRYV